MRPSQSRRNSYVPDAVPGGGGTENLTPIGIAAEAVHLTLASPGASTPETTVAVNNQGLVDLLEAAVTGLTPKQLYVLALASNPDGSGPLDPVVTFQTNPAGAAVVIAVGPLRRAVEASQAGSRRYLVIANLRVGQPGTPVQVQR